MKRACLVALLSASPAFAQSSTDGQSTPSTTQTPAAQTPRITEPPVTVTAQKEPADPAKLPISVTAVTKQMLDNAVVETPSDAARYTPNTFFSEFTVRKLSNPRMRGVGSSPMNPGVTTYFDGVPQLNANSSSITFLNVNQVEFVRGPQSALFGRNALGGLLNVETAKPSLRGWTGVATLPVGNHTAWDVNGTISGPVNDRLGVGFSIDHGERDGFTINDVTGNLLDNRSATAFKGQALWKPTPAWETRLILGGERARDGDYALNDLAALRANPFHAQRDFEGRTDRDIFSTTILTRHEGSDFIFSTTTGVVRWKTFDSTDLDYTPAPAATRTNNEEDLQFTQEIRLANAAASPFTVASRPVRWQTGLFFFRQNYDQNALNNLGPFVLSPLIPFPVQQTSPLAELNDTGFGVYGQGTISVTNRFDVTAGVRIDYENKSANMTTAFTPAIFPPVNTVEEQNYTNVSPQLALAFRLDASRLIFASAGRGYKAGGFNPTSPVGNETYDEERTWNIEGGFKTSLGDNKGSVTATVFLIDWDDIQLNQLNLAVPGQFFIANAGTARSMGIEIEAHAKPMTNVDVFGTIGTTRARFGNGSTLMGTNISDRILPNTPQFTGSVGTQISRPIGQLVAYGRAEVAFFGEMQYDETNAQSQGAYSLTDFRGGVRVRNTFVEGWVKNAFDTRYIPLAFAYQSASGFIGESGRPRTFGIRAGVSF